MNQNKELIYSHNIYSLLLHAGMSVSPKQAKELKEITSFNLEARYDDEKYSFYKKATKIYTDTWIKICNMYADDWEKLV